MRPNAELLTDLLRRGVVLERRGDRLHVEAPEGVLSDGEWDQLRQAKAGLLALLDESLNPEAAMQAAFALRDAWRRSAMELGEAAGWPEVRFRPERKVAQGELNWRKFMLRASVADLVTIVVSARERLSDLPGSADI